MGRTVTLAPADDDLYERDFYAWTQREAERIRALAPAGLDVENVAEEIESLGGAQKSEIQNRLSVLIAHLLKWEYQPQQRKYGWRATLMTQRGAIETVIEKSPSLRRFPAQVLAKAYRQAIYKACLDTDLHESAFPAECPYTLDEIMDGRFFPGPREPDVR